MRIIFSHQIIKGLLILTLGSPLFSANARIYKDPKSGCEAWLSGFESTQDTFSIDGNCANGLLKKGSVKWYRNEKLILEYKGDFIRGKQDGFGVEVRPESKYIGSWKNDLRDGFGQEFLPNGKIRFLGQFSDGLRNGLGVAYNADGSDGLKGYWRRGQLQVPFEFPIFPIGTVLKDSLKIDSKSEIKLPPGEWKILGVLVESHYTPALFSKDEMRFRAQFFLKNLDSSKPFSYLDIVFGRGLKPNHLPKLYLNESGDIKVMAKDENKGAYLFSSKLSDSDSYRNKILMDQSIRIDIFGDEDRKDIPDFSHLIVNFSQSADSSSFLRTSAGFSPKDFGVDNYVDLVRKSNNLNSEQKILVSKIDGLADWFSEFSEVNNARFFKGERNALPRVFEISKVEPNSVQAVNQRVLDNEANSVKESNNPIKSSVTSNSQSKRALVIGNDNYSYVPKLANGVKDSVAVADVLKSLGYRVTLGNDLNEKNLKSVIRKFKSEVNGGDEVVIYYAGHGVQIGSTNYILPTDIRADSEEQVKDEGIQLQRLLDDMSEAKVKLTLAVIDACRDNPFPKSGRSIGGRGLAPTTAATGQMIVFSAGAGQQALDKLGNNDKHPNGLFTRYLIKEMRVPGVRVDNVIREVRKQVVEAAKSVGHDQVPAIYDQVVGDFYFSK